MDRDSLQNMDVFMLLSLINMKLRDEFDSLNSLCDDYDIKEDEIKTKLRTIGYVYNVDNNQFISE
ncbi:DUF4250 domain-containing protein [Clostridium sp. SYSU_GA19001]|uniref:DUF4250 domain-containing protein n=1 Tax=Clostridium caldaquaticum TaxID=2940653 RepID=UPI002076DDA3|nr:DUF4250 domain-containing protein [Clostridium caldaquaticum]